MSQILFRLRHLVPLLALVVLAAGSTAGLRMVPARLLEVLSADSVSSPVYIAGKLAFKDKYAFIDYESNFFLWQNASAMQHFFDALKDSRSRKVTVVHIGDSHVQADIGTGHIRNFLQQVFGPGGRGLIFPYACAKTHPAVDYQTYSTGRWACARNVQASPTLPLGTMGVSARTDDSLANFRIVFNRFYNDVNPTVLKIFCELGDEVFDLKLKYGPDPGDTIRIPTYYTGEPYVLAYLPRSPGMLDFSFVKGSPRQNFFQIYGVSLETRLNQGVLYHSVGINGANFQHVLQQERMDNELAVLKPDLVVIDLSGNEFYHGLNEETFRQRLTSLIGKLKAGAPKASILVTCSQDIYRSYYYNIGEAARAAEIAQEVAFAQNCAFYDYYKVSGGRYSMLKWRAHQLAKTDRVHLTYEGYLLKGELFSNALLTSYHEYLKGHLESPFVAEALPQARFQNPLKTEPYTPVPQQAVPVAQTNWTPPTPPAGVPTRYYTVQQGDVLGVIAERYGVSVWQIRAWNGLPGDFIRVGQRLTIYSHRNPTGGGTAPAAAQKTTPNAPASSGNAVYHTVQAGDTLYGLANRYGTTVQNIMRLSGLSSDKLSLGQRLRVK
ncbi:MAG: LysM peptidoglycan-binding domain-containing protein [Bacteroidetes bacterium]|nr:LysM peptidoglycan-binding domain-containing protein [Bacteroidota bacterium]